MKEINFKFQISNFKFQIIGLILIILIHIFLLSRLIFFPYPELFIYPYLTNHGLLPYKQIFDQHFPGLFFLPINFETLGLTNLFAARFWQFALVLIMQCSLFFISGNFFSSYKKALAVCFLYLIWQPFFQGWVLWINNIMPIFYLWAFYFTYQTFTKKKIIWFFWAGVSLGLATLFKQVALPLTGLVAFFLFLINRSFKQVFTYSAGFLAIIAPVAAYVYGIGVFPDFWFWTIQFNATTYAQMGGSAPDTVSLKRIAGVLSPVIFLFFGKLDKKKILLIIFLIGGFFGGGNNFDFTYLQPALPFACIVTVAALAIFRSIKLRLFLIALYLIVTVKWLTPFYLTHQGDFVYYFDANTQAVAQIVKQNTKPGEEIFVYGATPLIYHMSQTVPAGKVFVFQFPWFLRDGGDMIYNGLATSQPRIIVSDPNTRTKDHVLSEFSPKLYNYIYSHYHLVQKLESIEILERN